MGRGGENETALKRELEIEETMEPGLSRCSGDNRVEARIDEMKRVLGHAPRLLEKRGDGDKREKNNAVENIYMRGENMGR